MAGEKRRISFTENELSFLENLIFEKEEFLDTKDSDYATVLAKKRVWWTIEGEFNSIPHHTKVILYFSLMLFWLSSKKTIKFDTDIPTYVPTYLPTNASYLGFPDSRGR